MPSRRLTDDEVNGLERTLELSIGEWFYARFGHKPKISNVPTESGFITTFEYDYTYTPDTALPSFDIICKK